MLTAAKNRHTVAQTENKSMNIQISDFQKAIDLAEWGTYGKDGKGPLKYVKLVDCETDHLIRIIQTQNCGEEYNKIINAIVWKRKIIEQQEKIEKDLYEYRFPLMQAFNKNYNARLKDTKIIFQLVAINYDKGTLELEGGGEHPFERFESVDFPFEIGDLVTCIGWSQPYKIIKIDCGRKKVKIQHTKGELRIHTWNSPETLIKIVDTAQKIVNDPAMKRDNWTNEEVIKLLDGCKLTGKVNGHNETIQDIIEVFEEFKLDPSISGAMAFNVETGFIEHIGPELPC